MSYRAMGAGPGPTITYAVDLPLPWGHDAEVTLPMEALVQDAWTAMEPRMDLAIAKGSIAVAASVAVVIGLAAYWMKRK